MTSAPTPDQTPKQTPKEIRDMLSAENFGDRIKAINQLRNIEPAEAFTLIQPLCDDGNTRVRYAAVSQIATLGEQDRPTAYKVLTASLGDPEPDVQAAAADALGALRLTDALDDLKELYNMTPEWLVKMSIVACLGEMGDTGAFELLQTALADDNTLISVAAIGAMGELKDPRAIPLLLPYASNDDWQVRHRIAQALGQFYQQDTEAAAAAGVAQALQKLAKDDSALVAELAQSYQVAS